MTTPTISLSDVQQVASETNSALLDVLTRLQAAAAKCGDNDALEQLTAIKSGILFGDE